MGLESDKAELVHFVTFVFLERIPNKVFVARLLHVIGKKDSNIDVGTNALV